MNYYTVTELTDTCHRFDVTELTVTELTCHRYGLSPIWLAPEYLYRSVVVAAEVPQQAAISARA